MRFVVKIGGSLIPDHIEALCPALVRAARDHAIVLVAGGGEIVDVIRGYRRRLTLGDTVSLSMAMLAMDQHALLLGEISGIEVVASLDGLSSRRAPCILMPSRVFAGELTGRLADFDNISSDTIAALLAEHLHAHLVIVTDVDGIFDADPRDSPEACLFDRVNASALRKATSIDRLAAEVVLTAGLKAWVVNGAAPDRIVSIVRNQPTRATEIVPA